MDRFKKCSRIIVYFLVVSPVFEWKVNNCHLPDQKQLLNKRSEIIAKCRHENKLFLVSYKEKEQTINEKTLSEKKYLLYRIFSRENYIYI